LETLSGCLDVLDLLARQATDTPGRTALVCNDARLSFAELERRADRLALILRRHGVGREVLVAIYLRRSATAVVAILAVLKAGGAYLPLDASLPLGRVVAVCVNAGVSLVLAEKDEAAALSAASVPVLDLTACAADAVVAPDFLPPVRGDPDDLGLVIYTSGSTGVPKGVEITRRSLAINVLHWEETHRVSRMGALAQCASFSFAIFQTDVFRALCHGLTLVICPEEVLLSPRLLIDLMRRERVGFAELVPSLIRALMVHCRERGQRLEFLRCLVISADRWYVREHQALARLLAPDARLVHVYGLSETTFDSTWYEGNPNRYSPHELVPIGRPFPGVWVFLLDEAMRPVAPGEPGEVWVGGVGVARGYRNRPDLTAQRFVPHPFAVGDRLYRTGDLGRLLPDGDMALLGRVDQQIEVHGFRIEPGEVETAIEAFPGIRQAVVVAGEPSAAGDVRLIAYISAPAPPDPLSLRTFLAARLPEYMLPAVVVPMAALPLTTSGKIDRHSLPTVRVASPAAATAQPEADLASIVSLIVRAALGVAILSPSECLRHRGLDSMGMLRILLDIEQTFSLSIPQEDIVPELFGSLDSVVRYVATHMVAVA
jgi:amino acid adenylation domain-containing protein